jgi:hypothetical protein
MSNDPTAENIVLAKHQCKHFCIQYRWWKKNVEQELTDNISVFVRLNSGYYTRE